MVDDAQTHCFRPTPQALDNVAQLHGLGGRRGAHRRCLRPHVERVGADVRRPRARGAQRSFPTIRTCLRERAARRSGFADAGRGRAARRRTGARARRARCARPPPSRRSRRCSRPCSARSPAGADPEHALNRLSDIVERLSSGVNLFRLLEARPALARAAGEDARPCPRAGRPARPAARAVRRPVRRVQLRDAAAGCGFRGALLAAHARPKRTTSALDRARRLVNERRFALGVQLIDRRRDPLEVTEGYARVAEGALRRAWRQARPPSSRRRTACSRTASWSSSGSAGSAATR